MKVQWLPNNCVTYTIDVLLIGQKCVTYTTDVLWLVNNVLLTQQMFSDWSTMCYLHNRCSLIGQQCVTYTPSISCNHFCWWTTCCHCSGNIIFVVYGMWCIRITTKLQRRKIKVSWSFLASYFSHYSVVRYDDCGLYTTVGQYWYGLLYIFIIEIYSS